MILKLYNFNHSSSAWRVRIALALKQVEFELIDIDVSRQTLAQDRIEYERVNPLLQVPCLEWDEKGTVWRLSQSVAIIEWLEHRFPDPRLIPRDAFELAKVREMVQVVNAGIQPLQNNRVLTRIKEGGANEEEWARHWIEKGLRALEALVQPWSGQYLFGDTVTMADIYLVPQLYNARRFGVDMWQLPTLVRVDQICAANPAFRATHPDGRSTPR